MEDPNFHPNHIPPKKGSREDTPRKGILSYQSSVGNWSTNKKQQNSNSGTKVKFKGSAVHFYSQVNIIIIY